MSHDEIANRIVIDSRPQKADPNRVRITAGGNLIKDYPGELTTRTADLTTSKILWNSVLSTEGAEFMGIDIKSFYLTTALDRYEYMKMPIDVFPEHTIQQYDLHKHVKNGFVYLEIRRCVYGLPMAGALANKLLRSLLAPHGYYEVAHTPGLWHHVTRPISFTLVVDDFGVKYEGQEHAQHLLDTLKKYYKLAEDWKGDLYCGITLDWDYENRTLDISLPGYIKKVLQWFEHKTPAKPQNCPFQPNPRKYGKDAQDPLPPDTTDRLDLTGTRRVQQVVGALLFYARAVDNTLLPGLGAIASEQAQATKLTMNRCQKILDYCASNPDAKIQGIRHDTKHPFRCILSFCHSGSKQSCWFYFLGSIPTDDAPIKLNGAILVFCGILKFVVASAAEAELGALFLNCKEGKIQRLILEELGHPQPPTPIHCDNVTATGIANDTIKKQCARAMEMRFFWVTDQVNQNFFNVRWQPGQENLADYFTKHFEPRHHLNVRPWYLHTRATAHFIIKGAMVKNKQPTCNPLKIKLPDGSVNQSTHTCNLDIPWLPDTVTEAHIVPGLAHSLLVATRKFCDAGCKISFDLDGCRIIYKGNVVLTGTRDPSSGLWRVPINPTSTLTTLNHLDLSNIKKDQQYAANLYTLPFKQQQLKYMHQSFFSPPPHTLIKAINKGQLEGIPFMKADLVRKYLAPSPATSKGRMKRPRQGIRSTRQRPHMATEQEYPMKDTPSSFTTNANIIPIEPTDGCACNVLCYAALADKHSGTMYTDATGALPAVSLEGNQYYFIAYAYDLNCIFALPISNLRDETILTAFDEVFQTLKSKGFKPAFNVTDNQAATPIKNISVKSKQVGSLSSQTTIE
eukprot:CCRYP_013223-RB/>CCRYP_013223-RB protein AED:0.40 eAED:0.40 QI:0/0/0/1/0/0/3/0/850